MGLAYGVLGTIAIVLLMGLGLKKRWSASTVGTVQGWTGAHVYLGLLTLIIIPFHAGLRFRLDIHTLAYALLVVVVLSGIVGVVLYIVIPPALTRRESEEGILTEQAPAQITQILETMRTFAGGKSEAFADAYREEFRKTIQNSDHRWRILFGGHGGESLFKRSQHLAEWINRIPSEEHGDFRRFSELALRKAKLEGQFLEHVRLHNAMQAWLALHVPFSFALMVLVFLHLFAVFYY